MISSRLSRRRLEKAFQYDNVSLLADYAGERINHQPSSSHGKPVNMVVLRANTNPHRPKLPTSIRVADYHTGQLPYIENLGWMLVYLLYRYPALKATSGFEESHIRCDERTLRRDFYEVHSYFTLDIGSGLVVNNRGETMTLEVVNGRINSEHSCWSIELFANGGFVRKIICETPDQVVQKLDWLLKKYHFIPLAESDRKSR